MEAAELGPQQPAQNLTDKSAKPRRKKTSRACIHCQRAHVTCDPGRPCQRCVKRGLQDTCRDGVRKKAKYLEGDALTATGLAGSVLPNLAHSGLTNIAYYQGSGSNTEQNGAGSSSGMIPSLTNSLPLTPPEGASAAGATGATGPSSAITQDDYSDLPSPYSFGSRATTLEYSILSNILRASEENSVGPSGQGDVNMIKMEPHDQNIGPSIQHNIGGATNTTNDVNTNPNLLYNVPQSRFPELRISDRVPASSPSNHDPSAAAASVADQQVYVSYQHLFLSPEDVYQNVTCPFPYTQGFHGLIAYLKSRFDKSHLMHVARAMAAYRPSFIAATNLLKEVDLIFMEQCFQRTLMEIQKIIPTSGTPTVVWRRTGQIAAVDKEFCILTGWAPHDLVDRTRFIVELMDDSSVIDYFDVFSKLAFGDSRGVTMTECTLLNPAGAKIPTACTWTVKRDVFDIPMMIIGNFLPIL